MEKNEKQPVQQKPQEKLWYLNLLPPNAPERKRAKWQQLNPGMPYPGDNNEISRGQS